MAEKQNIQFIDNAVIRGRDDYYTDITVDVKAVLQSWRSSLFSFEWLTPEGDIKTLEELSHNEKPKRVSVEEDIRSGKAVEKPVLGIGIQDNIEIGIGRAAFLTLAARGLQAIPVHIPRSNESDFKDYRADVNS